MSDELTPITRKETFLAKAGGQNVVTPTPITREETFLQAIIDNGSGGGGGGGVMVLHATVTNDATTLDKNWNEIKEAVETMPVYLGISNDDNYAFGAFVDEVMAGETGYIVSFVGGAIYRSDSPTGVLSDAE